MQAESRPFYYKVKKIEQFNTEQIRILELGINYF